MKKIIFLTMLTSLTISQGLFSQTKNEDGFGFDLLISTDNELSKYLWSCSKLQLSDTLLLDKDSILLTKGMEYKNRYFYLDTTFSDFNKLEVVFYDTNNSFAVYYFDFLKSVKNRKNSNKEICFHSPYKSDSLKWSFDRSSQLLKISSINNNSWTYSIKEIDKDRILLIKK